MSIVLITEHDENIYDIMDRVPKPIPSSSQPKQDAKPSEKGKHRGRTAKTMGKAPNKYERAVPTAEAEYNKTHKVQPKRLRPKAVPQKKVCAKDHPLPLLPWLATETESEKAEHDKNKDKRLAALEGKGIKMVRIHEHEKGAGLIIRRDLDFIQQNVGEVKTMKPRIAKRKMCVCPYFSTEPEYINKKDFGRFPNYIMARTKAKNDLMQTLKEQDAASSGGQAKCRYITRDERDQLLQGLKQNWEEFQKEFQSLPVMTDTEAKRVRKTNLEARLKQLEDDIVLIERHPYIYVYDDEKPDAKEKKAPPQEQQQNK